MTNSSGVAARNSENVATSPFVNAPFLIGVTGHMALEESAETRGALVGQLKLLFDYLRRRGSQATIESLVESLVPDPNAQSLRRTYRQALREWKGLPAHIPIVVLCNLAPGADTLVANFVLDGKAGENVHLRCPLPFPPEIYLGASTFVRTKDDNPDPLNIERQRGFLEALVKMRLLEPNLRDSATGSAALATDLEEALKAARGEQLFPVLLEEDFDLRPDELRARWCLDRDDKASRNRRYYAAGEYMALSAHLLVAIWDGKREASGAGTSAVVESRLRGPRYGTLPTTSCIAFPHGGPVWHLHANRPSTGSTMAEAPRGDGEPVTATLPPLRILHPEMLSADDSSPSSVVAETQMTNRALQTDRLQMLARVAESLQRFHESDSPSPEKCQSDFDKSTGRKSDPAFLTDLANAPLLGDKFVAALKQVSDIRRRAADLGTLRQDEAKRTMSRLFWLTFWGAVLLHFFSHWEPHPADVSTPGTHGVHASPATEATAPPVHTEPVSNHGGKSNDANQTAHDRLAAGDAAPASADTQSSPVTAGAHHQVSTLQIVCGWLALLLGGGALVYFAIQRSRRIEEQGHDARAIAEGLRVQFYWNLAGLGRGVSSNYMSRHRSELDWIRGVIRATSMPYQKWSAWFDELPDQLRIRALRITQSCWVADQLDYFQKSSHREHHRLHLCHKLGSVLALAGVATFLQLIAHERDHVVARAVAHVSDIRIWLGLLVATIAFSVGRALRPRTSSAAHGHPERPFAELRGEVAKGIQRFRTLPGTWFGHTVGGLGESVRFVRLVMFELVDIVVPTLEDSANNRTGLSRRMVGGVMGFAIFLPLAMVVSCTAIHLGGAIAHWNDYVSWLPTPPSDLHLGVIFAGMLLLGGALAVAWAEKNLFSEQAYQYNTMATLFHVANERLKQDLRELHSAIEQGQTDRRDELFVRIHELLFELGKEALDENAEWLLLHRARPLEPVMAG